MTDTQFDKIIQMVGMILDGCDDLDQAKEKIDELRVKNKPEKPERSEDYDK